MMDAKDGERLKMHPKFSAAKIEIGKPSEEKLEIESPVEEKLESPILEKAEDESEELSPEMIKKLLEMMNGE